MLYNLRSDIIYYKSSSDFELEFNLCGCCRMRLLTDKPSNKKAFVHSLARAVSRSRVILIAGPIFGEENTIEIVASALSARTEVVDNAAYGIASDEEIRIIKGALPLVSNDGSFGGCVIESGPQTMILLTDNKALRKNIMSTLIHPYISELYTAELNNNKKAPETTLEETTDELPLTDGEGVLENAEDISDIELYIPEEVQAIIPSDNDQSKEINEEDLILEEETEEVPLILSVDDVNKQNDITEDDIFIDTPESITENYVPDSDITIEDLFPNTPGFVEAARTLDEKINEANIIIEEDEYVDTELPENYHADFKNLFTEDDENTDDPLISEIELRSYSLYHEDEDDFEPELKGKAKNSDDDENQPKRISKLHIATIIVTVILLLSIIVLCYAIFTASTEEGVAPTQYIKEVWQAFFG